MSTLHVMSDESQTRPFFVKLSEFKNTEQSAARGSNTAGTVIAYGGSAIASVVGGTILGVGQDMTRAYTEAETHWHDQQRWPPFEAVECISTFPIALEVCYEGGRRVFSRRKPDR
jgi:hypothetical protein